MAARKILMLVGDYVEDYEVMVPFQASGYGLKASEREPTVAP